MSGGVEILDTITKNCFVKNWDQKIQNHTHSRTKPSDQKNV